MNSLELLKDHPKTAIVIKQWFLEKMLENLNTASIPDDYKEFLRKEGIDDDKVAIFIDASPRGLFDVFDNHKIYVEITIDDLGGFWWRIGETKSSVSYEFRRSAETAAIVEAFKLLEYKL